MAGKREVPERSRAPKRGRKNAAKGRLVERAFGPAADAFGKAIKPVGREVGQVTRLAVRALLRAVAGRVWKYDQIRGWIENTVGPKVERIPEQHRAEPSPTVAGPAIEAMRFAGSEPELRELFANLLAASMDARTAATAHPAFVEIIKQLTPDEARILKYLSERLPDAHPIVDLREVRGEGFVTLMGNYSHIGKAAGVKNDEVTPVSLENLCRLGLCEMPRQFQISPSTIYDALENDPALLTIRSQRAAVGSKSRSMKLGFRLNDLAWSSVGA